MKKLLLFFLATVLALNISAQIFEYESHEGSNGYTLPYRVMYPDGYDASKKYPLVVYLHGTGSTGTDNESQLMVKGLIPFLYQQFNTNYPSIVLVPQCSSDSRWTNTCQIIGEKGTIDFSRTDATNPMIALMELINEWKLLGYVDQTKMVVGGVSMGGLATFELLWRMPGIFSAAFPMCAGAHVDKLREAKFLNNTPIWLFQGSLDTTINPKHAQETFTTLIGISNVKAKYSEYPLIGHAVQNATFAEPRLGAWLFKESLPNNKSYYKMVSKNSNTAISSAIDNTLSLSYFSQNEDHQSFYFVESGISSYTIQTANNKYLSTDGSTISLAPRFTTANQLWRVKEISKGVYTITSVSSGTVLQASGNILQLASSYTGANTQKWDISLSKIFIGAASVSGSSSVALTEMMTLDNTKPNTFVWKGVLAPGTLKIAFSRNSWSPAIASIRANQGINEGETHTGYISSTIDNKFKISEVGNYVVTADLDKNTISLLRNDILDSLYIVGTSIDKMDYKTAMPMTLKKTKSGNEFVYEGLVKEGVFKFIMNTNSWANMVVSTVDKQPIITNSTSMYELGSDLTYSNGVYRNYNFVNNVAGSYRIAVNAKTMKMTVEPIVDNTPIYVGGSAYHPNPTNTFPCISEMTNLGNGEYIWQGKLSKGLLRFIRIPGTWNPGFYGQIRREPIVANYMHDIVLTTGVNQFLISEDAEYSIEINTVTKRMLINKTPTDRILISGTALERTRVFELVKNNGNIVNGLHEFAGVLDKGMFQLTTINGTILSSATLTPQDVTVEKKNYELTNVGTDFRFKISQRGVYYFWLDLGKRSVSISKVREAPAIVNKVNSIIETGTVSDLAKRLEAAYEITVCYSSVKVTSLNQSVVNKATLYNLNGIQIAQMVDINESFTLGNNLANGIYVVVLEDENGMFSQKVLIE